MSAEFLSAHRVLRDFEVESGENIDDDHKIDTLVEVRALERLCSNLQIRRRRCPRSQSVGCSRRCVVETRGRPGRAEEVMVSSESRPVPGASALGA